MRQLLVTNWFAEPILLLSLSSGFWMMKPGKDVALKVLLSTFNFGIVLANSLVILVILKRRSKTRMDYLLLNLAASDLGAGVFHVPVTLAGHFTGPGGLTGDVLCRLFFSGLLTWTCVLSSMSCLVFIAVDRYYAIMKPLSVRHRTTTEKLKVFIPVSWITCAILAVPCVYFWDLDTTQHICQLSWRQYSGKIYIVYWVFTAGIFPTSIMIVLYSRVTYRLWLEKNPNAATLQAVRRSRKKVTLTMLMISSLYVVCWCPDLVRHVLEVFYSNRFSFSAISSNLFHSVVLVNSIVNPVLYVFRFERFRRDLRQILGCGSRDRREANAWARDHNAVENKHGLEMRRK